jgi:hypothetical protein
MAQQTINIGTVANDLTGDPLRTAGSKINANFTELYASVTTALANAAAALASAAIAGRDWYYTIDRYRVWDDTDSGSGYAGSLGATFTGSGSATNPFAGDVSTPMGRTHETSTTQNNSYTVETDPNYFFNRTRVQCVTVGREKSTIGFIRTWIVFTSATSAAFTSLGGSDTPAQSFVGFRASTTIGGNWFAVTGNGAATTAVDTGVARSQTVAQTFRIEWDRNGTQVRFYIDTSLVATISATLPADTTAMRYLMAVTNLTSDAQVRSFLLCTIKVREGIIVPPS